MDLTVDHFPAFYEAVHGYDKFPWQQRLMEHVANENKDWPEVLALPTSSGKTSSIDVAVFALALQSGRPRRERTAPLRIFFIIDRRIVVDEAAEHARRLASKLEEATRQPEKADQVLVEVAQRLCAYSGGRYLPLHVVALRGAMYRDESWTSTPNVPTVCLSTVDQIGSRLLFRGYGLREYQWPIHAGLIGSDALLILDEAHLSNPFWETLKAVKRYQTWAEKVVTQPWRIVQMTATPSTDSNPFKLEEEDYRNKELGRRLKASKLAKLLEAPKEQFEANVIAQVFELAKSQKIQLVGIVVNRVASARQIFETLRRDDHADAILLTGRIRPFDRDRLLEKWLDRMRAGRKRQACPDNRKLFVVATQTVEVGANLDFDALVTEAATLDALRQRFGRLDRLGELQETSAVIVLRPPETDEKGKVKIDPIYREALPQTWDLLKRVATKMEGALVVDFGVVALDAVLKAARQQTIKKASFKSTDLKKSLLTKLYEEQEKGSTGKKSNPLIQYVGGRLTEKLRAELKRVNDWKPGKNDKADQKEKEKASKAITKKLADELNSLLKKQLYDAQAFAKLSLSDDTRELLESEPSAGMLVFLNRRLLEETFPQEIKKQPGLVTRHRDPAPILFPAHIDSWVQTSPAPHADPDPALFLHGRDALGCADVQIVWRADLDNVHHRNWSEIVALAPPVIREALPIPIWAACAWLALAAVIDVGDVEGIAGEEPQRTGRRALRWRGRDQIDSESIMPDQITPGETLLVPASYGGADEYGWHPSSDLPVNDIGDECANEIAHEFAVSAFRRRPYRLRLDVGRLRSDIDEAYESRGRDLGEEIGIEKKQITELLQAYVVQAEDRFNIEAAEAMLAPAAKSREFVAYPPGTSNRIVLTMKPKKQATQLFSKLSAAVLESGDDHTDSDDTASTIGVEISLRSHCGGVGRWARTFASDCGLSPELTEDLELAGRLHDLGKADRRFQIWLHGGDEIEEAMSTELLAKSGMQPNDRAAIRAAGRRAGYPEGARHELLSVALIRNNDLLKAKAHDWELVLHLVGTHHGRGRPFPPTVLDLKPQQVSVEVESHPPGTGLLISETMKQEKGATHSASELLTARSDHGLERLNAGWVGQFWQLVPRYGAWGLAYLEALLRLADYARSAQEQARNDR